ncbi:hypothetical protein GCM10007879_19410 [Maritalea porphyrae]|uniref:Uncharacterized protein n=1 Tax=Maritalea porphyrae TaxID=880732 RepID=A0ABQ5UUQ5_9HYPH|nr:hypothetical protein GCM10007879_19410 [Maritalea porphyrae]
MGTDPLMTDGCLRRQTGHMFIAFPTHGSVGHPPLLCRSYAWEMKDERSEDPGQLFGRPAGGSA